jgi:hypothetical protein
MAVPYWGGEFGTVQYLSSIGGSNLALLPYGNEIPAPNVFQAIDIDGQVLTANGQELLLNGIPVATSSNISSLAEWSYDPAISTIQANGFNIEGAASTFTNALLVSFISANSIVCNDFTAISTIHTSNLISSQHIYADDVNALQVSTGTLTADGIYNNFQETQGQIGVGGLISGTYQTDITPQKIVLTEANGGGLLPIPIPGYDNLNMALSNSTFTIALSNSEVQKAKLTMAPTGMTFIDQSGTTTLTLNNGITTAPSLSWNNGLATGQTTLNSLSTNNLTVNNALLSNAVVPNLVAGALSNVGNLNTGSLTVRNGPNQIFGATTIEGSLGNDVVLQNGLVFAENGFRISGTGIFATTNFTNTSYTGLYESHTVGQYYDILAGGQLTLQHGNALGDNAVVVQNQAANANATMWFKYGGRISTLTTLDTQDLFVFQNGFINLLNTNFITANGQINVPTLNTSNFFSSNYISSPILLCSTATATTANISTLNVSTFNYQPFVLAAYSSTNQQVIGANTPTELNYNSVFLNQGGFDVLGSTITVPVAGKYVITHSIQFNTTSGGIHTVDFWYRKNGADMENSGSRETVANNAENLGTIELIDDAVAGDQYSVVIASPDANMNAAWFPASTSPYNRPGIPSIITNIKRLGN